jgi:hypothetical protein
MLNRAARIDEVLTAPNVLTRCSTRAARIELHVLIGVAR